MSPATVQKALEPWYDNLALLRFTRGAAAFNAEREGERCTLRVWAVSDDPSPRIPEFLDGPARARHPALATTLGARYLREASLLVHEQAPPMPESMTDPSCLDAPQRLETALAVASALAYAHEQGWVHGSIGLDAVAITPSPRLFDLGTERLRQGVASADKDINDFFDFLWSLDATDEDPLGRWLRSPIARQLRSARPSMRAVESALADLENRTYPSRFATAAKAQPPRRQADHPEWIDHFQVQKMIGQGGLADVFVARDTVLGRRVALKLLRADAVNESQSSDLLEEARAMASFQHPNIVVLYGVGRYQRQVYLALEYLPGQTLTDAIKGSMPVTEAVHIGLAIARALREAHRQGILHCDLKPSNVLLPEDGRPRVVDFGLARALNAADAKPGRSWSGTPAYMAPEQWQGEKLTTAVDMWAFGLILFEMVEGRRAQTAGGLSHLPPGLDDGELLSPNTTNATLASLIVACLRRAPEGRPSADDAVRTLERLSAVWSTVDDDETTPFRGLESFDERHARFFVGREEEADQFARRLRTQPYLTVVGPSGVGKSSFIKAAVIPRLAQTERWTFIHVRPSTRPLRALAAQLIGPMSRTSSGGGESAAQLALRLAERPNLLNLKLHDRAEETGANILLFVDQAEELVTTAGAASEAKAFVAAIVAATDGPDDSVRVVATLRDDFVGRIAAVPGSGPWLDALFVLQSPGRDMLLQCVAAPLRAVGYRLEPESLADRLVDDVRDASAQLPVLQFACTELWNLRNPKTRTIDAAAYDYIGGAQGALAKRADAVMAAMPPAQFDAAKAILLRLIGPENTRQLRDEDDLVADLDEGPAALQRLIEGRLVTIQRRPGRNPNATTCELVHEALIRSWDQLAKWADDTSEERRLIEELEDVVRPWLRRGARDEETWEGPIVRRTRARFEALNLIPPSHIRRFLDRGAVRNRRKRFGRIGLWAALWAAVGVLGVMVNSIVEQTAQMRRANQNLGRFELVLVPFDVDPATQKAIPVAITDLPAFEWVLQAPSKDDAERPGATIEAIRTIVTSSIGARYTVEARGGSAFLSIRERGRKSTCGPSVVPLRRLPGYAERGRQLELRVWFPVCRASLHDLVPIPSGPFIQGGPGTPPTRFESYIEPELFLELPKYSMDRIEVSNRALAHFTRMASTTGHPHPIYLKDDGLAMLSYPTHPAVQVPYRTAIAYCRFHGKRLPTSLEWEKAARGGINLAPGVPNPYPRRSEPWGTPLTPRPANIEGAEDGFATTAPVNAMPAGRSPYGLLNMAGNALEWTSTPVPENPDLRVVRGGDWLSPPRLQHWYIAFENKRPLTGADLALGFRCAAGRNEH